MIQWRAIEDRISDTRIYYHPDAECTIKVSTLKLLLGLRNEVVGIAQEGILPDGDGVNIPTLIWAEDWARK